jgi:hypothetical protein
MNTLAIPEAVVKLESVRDEFVDVYLTLKVEGIGPDPLFEEKCDRLEKCFKGLVAYLNAQIAGNN